MGKKLAMFQAVIAFANPLEGRARKIMPDVQIVHTVSGDSKECYRKRPSRQPGHTGTILFQRFNEVEDVPEGLFLLSARYVIKKTVLCAGIDLVF